PPTPTEDRRPAWRRACLAYREIREAGGSDQEAHEAAVAAVQSVLTQLSWKRRVVKPSTLSPMPPSITAIGFGRARSNARAGGGPFSHLPAAEAAPSQVGGTSPARGRYSLVRNTCPRS